MASAEPALATFSSGSFCPTGLAVVPVRLFAIELTTNPLPRRQGCCWWCSDPPLRDAPSRAAPPYSFLQYKLVPQVGRCCLHPPLPRPAERNCKLSPPRPPHSSLRTPRALSPPRCPDRTTTGGAVLKHEGRKKKGAHEVVLRSGQDGNHAYSSLATTEGS